MDVMDDTDTNTLARGAEMDALLTTLPTDSVEASLLKHTLADLHERVQQHLARARATARTAQALYHEACAEMDELRELRAAHAPVQHLPNDRRNAPQRRTPSRS